MKLHHYKITTQWTGNFGQGTTGYTTYGRNFISAAIGKPDIQGSADPAFRGDAARWNPEEMLLAALSSCHKLWYLHLCAVNNVVVTAYQDNAEANMDEDSGQFIAAQLNPRVTISHHSDKDKAQSLHEEAHHACFIANSVCFPVTCVPKIIFESETTC